MSTYSRAHQLSQSSPLFAPSTVYSTWDLEDDASVVSNLADRRCLDVTLDSLRLQVDPFAGHLVLEPKKKKKNWAKIA